MKKREILLSLGIFVPLYILYNLVVVRFEQAWLMWVYSALLIIALAAFVIVKGDFPIKEIKREQLPRSFSETDKDIFIGECTRRRKIFIPLLIVSLAIGLVLLLDMIFLFLPLQRFDLFGGIYG